METLCCDQYPRYMYILLSRSTVLPVRYMYGTGTVLAGTAAGTCILALECPFLLCFGCSCYVLVLLHAFGPAPLTSRACRLQALRGAQNRVASCFFRVKNSHEASQYKNAYNSDYHFCIISELVCRLRSFRLTLQVVRSKQATNSLGAEMS